jgi:imidazolonepropionase-like amidohydrolase
MGIDDVTGTLEPGKRADVVMWSGSPFSVYSRAELVIAGGEVTFDRSAGSTPSDFELGNAAMERAR